MISLRRLHFVLLLTMLFLPTVKAQRVFRINDDFSIPFGPVDLDLGNVVKLSASKGFYFGLSAKTNQSFSEHVQFRGYGGYWLKLKGFDYGGSASFSFGNSLPTSISLHFDHHSATQGEFNSLWDEYDILSPSFYRFTFYENVNVRGDFFETRLTNDITPWLRSYLSFGLSQKNYLRQRYISPDDPALLQARYATAELKLNVHPISTAPVIWTSYTHSFSGILGSTYDYNRIKVEIYKNLYYKNIGYSSIVGQFGYVDNGAPVMEAFDIVGTKQFIHLYAPNCFSTMGEDEFICDRFVALFLSHHFCGLLVPTDWRWSKPQLTVATNMGWGDFRRAAHAPDRNFKTMEKGYFESGIVLDGLFRTDFVDFGASVFYRYGPYAFERTWDNFAFKWNAVVRF